MRKLVAAWLIAWMMMVTPGFAEEVATDARNETRLPVRKVVLYKNGVGYFEHSGRVRGSQDVTVDFTTAQLNDVLQSLTVLDLGKGRITGVSYNSTAPLDQRLRSLHLPLGEKPTTAAFLDALRGARVEIRNDGTAIAGRLLSVEEHQRKLKDDSTVTITQVSLITDSGEMRTFELTPSTSVRVLDADLQKDVSRYLQLLGTTRQQDSRRMTISTSGPGDREMFVSYISEVPVWKSTYRIVLPEKLGEKPILQGWAVVDNTVGEDWDNVQLALVAGAPQSFVQQISQPYYTRRPVVPLPSSVMLAPQTYEATIGGDRDRLEMFAKLNAEAPNVATEAAPVEQLQLRVRDMSKAAGASGGVVGGAGEGVYVFRATANQPIAATSQDLGDLFEYKLTEPVTIHKNQSALVPILQAKIDAEKVSMWNDATGHALRGLWLTNSSNLTLDAGSFNVIDDEAFAGEGLLDPVKPGERRLVSYAVDLGVRVESRNKAEQERASTVRLVHGILTQTTELREQKTYVVRNEDATPRTIVIEHPARAGWKLTDGQKPAETSANFYRFRMTVDPHKTAELPVSEFQPVQRTYMLSNLSSQDIDLFVRQKSLSPELERVLRKVVAQKSELAAIDGEIRSRKEQMTSISDDQQRVRENLKALKGSAEEKLLVQRYTRQLNEQEDRVDALRKSIADLQQKRADAQRAFDKMLEGVAFGEGTQMAAM